MLYVTDNNWSLRQQEKQLETPTVVYEMKENQVGYIAVSEFDEVTLSQFETALNDLESQGDGRLDH